MKISSAIQWPALLAMLGMTLFCAQAATLKVGDPAPKLQVSKWVQGDPVTAFEPGKAYIVEFWATWCGPCRMSIPHLNEIHTKYKNKGLIVIGQNVLERSPAQVPDFIKEMGTNMTYRVAMDDIPADGKRDDGAMAQTWMKAADMDGIPTAFLITTNGLIAWIGHPMTLEESTIEQVLSGQFDIKKAIAEQQSQATETEELSQLAAKLNSHLKNSEWDEAQTVASNLEKHLSSVQKIQLNILRVHLYGEQKDMKSANELADRLSDANTNDARIQNSIAWSLLEITGIKSNHLAVAEKAANRASQLTEGKIPAILDTQARIAFLQGNKDKALELENKALSLTSVDKEQKFIKKTIDSYKAGHLPDDDD
jgi:thiol-disulfide isomerase/thioredoxin